MSISLAEEQLFPLGELPDHLPLKKGKKAHKSIGFRWKNGLRGIALETVRCGGTLCTSIEAVQRFFDRLSALDVRDGGVTVTRTPASRRKAVERAECELDRLGV